MPTPHVIVSSDRSSSTHRYPARHQPEQARVMPTGGGHARTVAVQHERQQHLQRLGLARAIGTAQQEPPLGELEDLVVVLPDVEHARPREPEPVAHGWSSAKSDGCPSAAGSAIDGRAV
jgi:hypothetical protein